MFKYTVTFEDFDGNAVEETIHFNLSKPEILKLNRTACPSGFKDYQTYLNSVAESNDAILILDVFSDLVVMAYGEKSDDGRRFIKSKELAEAFAQTAAYDQFLADTLENPDIITQFIYGIMPKDLVAKIKN